MTNRQMKKKLREAFSHGTPDISQEILMDTLLSDPQGREGVEMSMEEQRKPIRFPVFSVAAAACAAIAVLAISINLITNRPQGGNAAFVTPEEALDAVYAYHFDKPTIAVAPNVEWELDVDDPAPHYEVTLSYAGPTAYKFVVDAKTGKVLSMEEIPTTDTRDPITQEEAKRIALQAAQVEDTQITGYTCESDPYGGTLHFDVSFRHVNALYHFEIDAYTGEILNKYILNAVNYLSEADAKAIALVSVQVTESEITSYSITFQYDSRLYFYDIIFIANNIRYSFQIDAITGNVLNTATESVQNTFPDTNVVIITPVSVALRHAGFSLGQVANLECHEDMDDEIPHIDVSFIANGLKYEYEVKAGGTILDFETEPMEDDFISPSEATEKFYEYLNITPAPLAVNLSWSIVNYEGRMCYDIIHTSFDGSAIRMKIDAVTGELLLKETPDGLQPIPDPSINPPDGKISADRATFIALNQVGLSSTRLVTDFELEEDTDDEHPHYDVSFVYQGTEYSFEIGMYDGGNILNSENEPID